MATLKEFAKEFTPSQMKNIADLEVVRTDQEIKEEKRQNKEGEEYVVKFVVVNDEEYRVPSSVIEQLKMFLESRPELKTFQVKKSGQGLNTKYQVIPLD